MNTGSKATGAARLPNGTNPGMCMYQVSGTRRGCFPGALRGGRGASRVPVPPYPSSFVVLPEVCLA